MTECGSGLSVSDPVPGSLTPFPFRPRWTILQQLLLHPVSNGPNPMNRTIATCLFSALLACCGMAMAQSPRIFIDPAPLPPPVRLDIGQRGQPIELQSMAVRSEIAGGLARTRVEMLFFNPNDRVLEGELRFPLLAGQEIDGFALDIDGELREAVPVEKARGKQVLEEVIRRRVDPALLETTAGENFRLRVGYNHFMRKELSVDNFGSLAGFSLGGGIKVNRFRIDYGHTTFHLGGGLNQFSISTNLQEFKR